jgi:hypothetical protein
MHEGSIDASGNSWQMQKEGWKQEFLASWAYPKQKAKHGICVMVRNDSKMHQRTPQGLVLLRWKRNFSVSSVAQLI